MGTYAMISGDFLGLQGGCFFAARSLVRSSGVFNLPGIATYQ
jgi:hypothetical protein